MIGYNHNILTKVTSKISDNITQQNSNFDKNGKLSKKPEYTGYQTSQMIVIDKTEGHTTKIKLKWG